MADIQTYLKKILSAVYGKDVRQSIHDAIHQCYEDGKAGTIDLEARERIDQFTKLTEGSTTGDAELQDIRAGVDGESFDTAGKAVREQVRDVRSGSVKENLIDITKLSSGFIDSYGALDYRTFAPRWEKTSDYILIDTTQKYTVSIEHEKAVDGWIGISAYDADKNYLRRVNTFTYNTSEYSKTMKFDSNVVYVRVSYRSFMLADIKFEQSMYASRRGNISESADLMISHPLVFEGYINDSGSINMPTAEGYISGEPAMKERFSSFIPVVPGDTYTLYHLAEKYPWFTVGFCDSSCLGISRVVPIDFNANKFTFVVPENAYTMYVAARTHYLQAISLFKNEQLVSRLQRIWENYIELSRSTDTQVSSNVKAVAHRGFSSGAPENTLPAYRLARKYGFDYAECDVSFTSDGVAVLLHDSTINRTSTGTGSIASLTYAEAATYDYGYADLFGEDYIGTKIPTFEEFVALCRNIGLKPYIELKAGTEAQIIGLVSTVKKYGMIDSSTWISFQSKYLEYVKNAYGKARLGYVVSSVTSDVIATAKNLQNGVNEVFIDSNTYTDNEVNLCINGDLAMELWTYNDPSVIKSMPAYVSGVTSDSQNASKLLYEYSMNE